MSAPAVNPPRAAQRGAASDVPAPAGVTSQPVPSMGLLTGFNGNRRVPVPANEPVRSYAPGSPERAALKARLESMASERIEIPVIIGGKEYRSGEVGHAVMPHAHGHVLIRRLVPVREHVTVGVRHHCMRDLPRAIFPATYDDRNLDALGCHGLEARLEGGALGRAGRV